MQIPINNIRTDGGTQPRATIDENTIRDYAIDMLEGDQFPPVVVFFDGTDHWLSAGFHRVAAAQQIGRTAIDAVIKTGTARDAFLFAVEDNRRNGVRYTNADKRSMVERFLNDPEWVEWSDREIARRTGVDHKTVAQHRTSLGKFPSDDQRQYITRHGTLAIMNTANIGRLPFDPEDDDLTPYEQGIATRYDHYPTAGEAAKAMYQDGVVPRPYLPDVLTYIEMSPGAIPAIEKKIAAVHEAAVSVEWYTPAVYVEAARATMGGIDTDPASNEAAQTIVQAETYYTEDVDGFDKSWRGRVWLNPPYGAIGGRAVAAQWTERLIQQFDLGIVTEAILLVNAVIDSKWFDQLWRFPICFTNHRIRFDLPAGAPADANTSPIIGSAFVYMGSNVAAFVREFSRFGAVVSRLHTYDDQVFTEMELAHDSTR